MNLPLFVEKGHSIYLLVQNISMKGKQEFTITDRKAKAMLSRYNNRFSSQDSLQLELGDNASMEFNHVPLPPDT